MSKIYSTLLDIIPETPLTNLNIVIDLDETLIHTQEGDISILKKSGVMTNPKYLALRDRIYHFELENVDSPGLGCKSEMWGITRPHTSEFLLFCMIYFKRVIIWSAGKREYVDMVLQFIFKDLKRPPIVYTYDETSWMSGKVLKPLKDLYDIFPDMNETNTLTLDDNHFAVRKNKSNAIMIPEYQPSLNLEEFMKNDTSLLQVMSWLKLKEVRNCVDVRKLDKSKIFMISLQEYRNRLQE